LRPLCFLIAFEFSETFRILDLEETGSGLAICFPPFFLLGASIFFSIISSTTYLPLPLRTLDGVIYGFLSTFRALVNVGSLLGDANLSFLGVIGARVQTVPSDSGSLN